MSGTTAHSIRTSRRVIVKSGARLAYAAPVVAASTRIGQSSAAALSAPVFGPDITISIASSTCLGRTLIPRQVIVSGAGWTAGNTVFLTAGLLGAGSASVIVGSTGTFGPITFGTIGAGAGTVQVTATDITVISQVIETVLVGPDTLISC